MSEPEPEIAKQKKSDTEADTKPVGQQIHGKPQSIKPEEGPRVRDIWAEREPLRARIYKMKLPEKPGPEQTKQEPTE